MTRFARDKVRALRRLAQTERRVGPFVDDAPSSEVVSELNRLAAPLGAPPYRRHGWGRKAG